MRNIGANSLGAILFSLLGVFYLFCGRQLAIKGQFGPGPGFFPLTLGIALIVLSCAWWVTNRFKGMDFSWRQLIPSTKPVLMLAGCIGFSFFIDILGTVIALFALTWTIWFFEKISWWLNLILSLSISLGLYLIFKVGLGVALPEGLLWF